MRSRAPMLFAAIVVFVAPGCGGSGDVTRVAKKPPSKPGLLDNTKLGRQVTKDLRLNAPAVCWTKTGVVLGRHYNRVCGFRRDQPTIFVRRDGRRGTWCAVSPRFAHVCR